MRRIILLAALAFSLPAVAQNFNAGLRGGVNISNFSGGDFGTIKNKALLGFHAGGFLQFRFGQLALQPGLLFSSQGATLESAGSEENFRVSYLNVPVLLNFETKGGFFLEAGPQVGFKISEDIPNQQIGDFAKGLDLSAVAGLGYHTKSGFGLGARYNIGLSKVGDFTTVGNLNPDFKNGVIQLSLFFTLIKPKMSDSNR